MRSIQGYHTLNSHGHKSKYFYLRDKRKRGHQISCRHCGSIDSQQGCEHCSDYDHHHQHRCQKCGSTDCEPDFSICKRCRHQHDKPDYDYDHEHHYDLPVTETDTVSQSASQYDFMDQESSEMIWVKESCNIRVDSTDTQIGVSLQASLQLAIAVVLNIAIADSGKSETISQELFQNFDTEQVNKQKIYIYNTKDAVVTAKDTDLAINIQVMLQLLIALTAMIDVL